MNLLIYEGDIMKLVSIIMGIYNCGDTLSEAIESLLKQTYTNWELIMCDDASKDNTYELAKSYENVYYPQIRVLKNEKNLGLNKTLNNCLKEVKGEYVARMDGDDVSAPERLEKEVDFLNNNLEYGFVSCLMLHFDEKGEWHGKKNPETPTLRELFKGGIFCHAPCMIRKEVYDAVGGYSEDKRLLRVEDFNLWHKIYAAGYKGYNIQQELYKMRDDREAFSRRTFKARMNGTYAVYLGYKMLNVPWYYIYLVVIDFFMNFIKTIMPLNLYNYFHKIDKV